MPTFHDLEKIRAEELETLLRLSVAALAKGEQAVKELAAHCKQMRECRGFKREHLSAEMMKRGWIRDAQQSVETGQWVPSAAYLDDMVEVLREVAPFMMEIRAGEPRRILVRDEDMSKQLRTIEVRSGSLARAVADALKVIEECPEISKGKFEDACLDAIDTAMVERVGDKAIGAKERRDAIIRAAAACLVLASESR